MAVFREKKEDGRVGELEVVMVGSPRYPLFCRELQSGCQLIRRFFFTFL